MSNRVSGQAGGPEDRVERAAAALRGAAVPAGPTEDLLEKTMARLGAVPSQRGSREKGWWSMKMVRRTAAAAGLLVAVTAVMLWVLPGRGVAFGDVIEQVRAAKALRCTAMAEVQMPDGTKQTSESEMLMVDSGWMINTTQTMTFVMNQKEGKGVMLLPAQKQAIVVDGSQPSAKMQQEWNLLEQFRTIQAKDGKALGEKEIAGVKARGFEVQRATSRLEVWADEKTEQPVLAVMEMRNAFLPPSAMRLTHFDWNPQYDARELTLTPPDGYTVTKMALGAADEGDVVGMLRQFAEFNDGAFPDHLGVTDLAQSLGRNMTVKTAGMTAEQMAEYQKKIMPEVTQQAQTVGRGWQFMSDATKGSDWHYAGKGVKQGEAGKAVLWYRPAGSERYRVIDADLKVHEAKAGELPEGEKLEISWPVAPNGPVIGVTTEPAATQGK